MRFLTTIGVLWCILAAVAFGATTAPERREIKPPNPARVRAIAAMLPDAPAGFGRPISDRAAWEKLGKLKSYKSMVSRAEDFVGKEVPDLPDSLFLDFSKTGNRTRWQRRNSERSRRFRPLVIAECVENKGRFIPTLEKYLRALCAEKTWVMPAHDRSLKNFKGTAISIDLRSSAVAFDMGQMLYLLGDKLSPEVRDLVRRETMRRVLTPFRQTAEGKRASDWWMRGTNNWNAVCHAGVVGAALAMIEDKNDRALYAAAAEDYVMNFVAGFPEDGYCTEGTGYWNYGFGRFVILTESLRQATGGGIDLMAHPHVKKAATFGARIQIINGVVPAFADCGVNARPATNIMWFVSRRYGLGLKKYDEYDPVSAGGWLPEAMMYSFPNIASETPPAKKTADLVGKRSYFDEVGILISRPGDSKAKLGVALKGGNNAEHHNHNDVGSYVAVVGTSPLVLDVGGEVYTARTFSKQRYVSDVLNSFGHPVPVVAGKLQRTGKAAQAKVLATNFTDAADTLKLDISRAYEVPELKKLERTFVYSREGEGSLTVTDEVEFMSPESFETAFLTASPWRKQDDGSFLIYDTSGAVRVTIDTGGAPWKLAESELTADQGKRPKPTRFGIRLEKPVTKARVTVKAEPTTMPGMDSGQMLRNGGFEFGKFGWSLSDKGVSTLSTEQAASGKTSLKIVDPDKKHGSSTTSAMVPVDQRNYVLRGKFYPVSGGGVGMYVKYYNDLGKSLNETSGNGNIAPVGSLSGKNGQGWQTFQYPFTTPEGTTRIRVWIHSYTGAIVTVYLDDLEIVPADKK